ncbi:TetR/AcrR family transcriptional regulator [Arcicella rigui]|uniref:TetR/AcrR family transcriptional regulator n=1 Tax=Arcicella rigui TaxID=797020 RepID=A0ABU5QFW7_9BACT|nr:TetR/AcrR family transcriptional regulator [Arcicella rigui]MEA5141493.1 TetR/AcrR family transcriptional regulator [Arcicella rigui]
MRIKDESKESIIFETALLMISKTGLSGLKMSQLAKEANIATGTVYIYFKDKDELIRKLYLYLLKKTTLDYSKGLDENVPLKLKIKILTFNYLAESILHPEYGAFFEQYFRSPFFVENEMIKNEENTVLGPIYELVIEGQKQAIIKNINPELLVSLVCGMLNEVAKESIYTQSGIEKIDWESIFTVIWDGIKS